MLLRFSFENFRSFKNKTTLSMLATTQRTLNDVLIRKGNLRILPSAVLYGANASGKSNVILAMMALCAIVDNGSVSRETNSIMSRLELFPFVHDENTEPISFEIEFLTNEDRFVYNLAVGVEPLKQNGNRYVIEEKLEQVLAKETVMLFHRTQDDIIVGNDIYALKILGYQDAETLKLLVNSVVQNMDEETLFLTGGFKSTISKGTADKIINYLSDSILVTLSFSDMLHATKTAMLSESIPTDNNIMLIEELFDRIIKAADFGPQQIGWQTKEKGGNRQNIHELEMVSIYKNIIIPSDLMESEGTTRLLIFAPMLRHYLAEGGLLMIDEMDNAIHPEIMKSIIALFSNPEVNKNGAQLIFTSHNPIYMEKDLLRRDQILFTERDADTYESTLYSLGDFGSVDVRNDQSFMRNYFKGRYSRLPYIDLEAILTQSMEV